MKLGRHLLTFRCHCRSWLSADEWSKRIQRRGPNGEHAHGVWPSAEYPRWEQTPQWILAFGVQWLHQSRAGPGGSNGELVLSSPQRVRDLHRDLHADTMPLH